MLTWYKPETSIGYMAYCIKEEKRMIPNSDETKGKWEQVKGTVKAKVGEFTGDRDLEAEGEAQNASGDVQEGYGKAKRKIGETIEDIGQSISK